MTQFKTSNSTLHYHALFWYSGYFKRALKNHSKQKQNGEDQFEELEWHFRIQNLQLYSRITNAFVMILQYTLFDLVLYSLKLTYQV